MLCVFQNLDRTCIQQVAKQKLTPLHVKTHVIIDPLIE